MVPVAVLQLTREELLALHAFLRRALGSPDYGKEWSKEFMLNVYHGVLAGASPYTLVCNEADLWMITRQVPKDYRVGTEQVGRALLFKVFTELLRFEEGRREYTYDDHDGKSYDDAGADDPDYLAGDGPGAGSPASP